MDEKINITAIVPMRHGSERVPDKNFRSFAGVPLYHHIVKTLLRCRCFGQIVIDTDSPVILEDAVSFPQVKIIERPAHLGEGTVPMNDVLLNSLGNLDGDFFLQTHSTNPLLRDKTIEKAVEMFFDKYPDIDSMFSVTGIQKRFWRKDTQPLNHDPVELLRTQDLEPVYEENSCFYIFSRESLVKNGNRIGEKPLMYEIDRVEAQDIDDELDFQVCEFLYNNGGAGSV